MPKLPVVAAIANYNMAAELKHLLPQVMQQGYDEIYVLDDASTDNSKDVVSKFKGVTFVAGRTNRGAGGNRNRIIGALKHDALIHFLDADLELLTEDTAKLVREVAPAEPFGLVGGLIKTSADQPHPWNYCNGAGLRSSLGSWIQMLTCSQHSKLAHFVRRVFKTLLADWPDPTTRPNRRKIYWCAEANMIVRSDIFASLGGFDESFRETEILNLAMRMHRLGLPCYFDPAISVRHTEGKVRGYNRDLLKTKEMLRFGHQLGLKSWLFSDGKTHAAANQ